MLEGKHTVCYMTVVEHTTIQSVRVKGVGGKVLLNPTGKQARIPFCYQVIQSLIEMHVLKPKCILKTKVF
jgi:hypothetical protein